MAPGFHSPRAFQILCSQHRKLSLLNSHQTILNVHILYFLQNSYLPIIFGLQIGIFDKEILYNYVRVKEMLPHCLIERFCFLRNNSAYIEMACCIDDNS